MSQSKTQIGSEYAKLKEYLVEYTKPDDVKAWIGIGWSLLFQALIIALIHFGFGVIGWPLNVLNSVRMFVQFHDMAHFSYFSSIALNKFFGKILGVYTHFPFNSWRDGHNHHHKHFGNLDRLDLSQTILFTKKQYEQMTGFKKIAVRILRQPVVFFLFTAPYVWFVGVLFTNMKRYGVFSATTLQKVISIVLFTWGFPYFFGISSLMMWFTVYGANVIGTILFHLQHAVNVPYRQRQQNWNFTKAALQGSTFLDIPTLLRPFTNGIQYHHIHHLNSNVASYAIGQCHHIFQEKYNWDSYQINRVDWKLALKSMNNVMYDEENDKLVPFSYL